MIHLFKPWTWFVKKPVQVRKPCDEYLTEVINFVFSNPNHSHYVVVRSIASKKLLEAAFQKITNVKSILTLGMATQEWHDYESNCALSCATLLHEGTPRLAQLSTRLKGRNSKYLLFTNKESK